MNLTEFLIQLKGVTFNGDHMTARCPAHDDHQPSLSVTRKHGRLLVHCFAGCPVEKIVKALGFTLADLFTDDNVEGKLGEPAQGTVADSGDSAGSLDEDVERRRHANEALCAETQPDPGRVEEYFKSRGFSGRVPDILRFHGALGYFDQGADGHVRHLGDFPAMIAPVQALDGEIVALHRTYLDPSGSGKAAVPAPKKLTPAIRPGATKGAAIRLAPAGETLAITEGIETGTAVMEAIGAPVWVAVSAGGMETIQVPASVRQVLIWADHDPSGRGQQAAETAAARLTAEGRGVSILLPAKEGDWLDVLNEYGPEALQDALRDAQPGAPASEWEPAIPFHTFYPPPFPTGVFPGWMRDFVEAEAIATQTPPDLAAMLGLSVVATACAKTVEVQVTAGYIEPLNIFTVTVLAPGNRKSAVFKDMEAPIEAYEADQVRMLAPEIAEARHRYEIAAQTLEKVKKDAAKAKPGEREVLVEEASRLARDLEAMRVPALPRYVADDVTSERLATLIRDQRGRMAVMAPEGDVFDLMAGRYAASGIPNFGVYVRGHAGDTLRVDRVGRPPEYVPKPAVTMGLTVQPDVIQGLIQTPRFRGRGLLGRNLYSIPESPLGRRDSNPPPMPEQIRAAYEKNLRALLDLPADKDQDGYLIAKPLRLSEAAWKEHHAFAEWVEPQLAPHGDLGYMSDWGGKLVGAVVRIAGLLHMAGHVDDAAPWEIPIARETFANAVRVGEYLIPHAKAAYAEMGADPAVESARSILRWIEAKQVVTFTKRALFEGVKGRFKRVDALEDPLTLLTVHGFIRPQTVGARSGPGRKPSPRYEVNPLWRPRTSDDSQHRGRVHGSPHHAKGGGPGPSPREEGATPGSDEPPEEEFLV